MAFGTFEHIEVIIESFRGLKENRMEREREREREVNQLGFGFF